MRRLKIGGAAVLFLLLILKTEAAVAGAQKAMQVWYSAVAPSLFPFLALMPLLTSEEACAVYEKLFSKWMRPLFKLPGAAAPAVIGAMVAGSPGGAVTLRRVAFNANLTGSEIRRIALAMGGVSPAYLIAGVGQRLYGSTAVGIKLAAAQAFVQLILLLVLPVQVDNGKPFMPECTEVNRNPVLLATESILVVCGYMVFYSAVSAAIASIAGNRIGNGLLLVMDLPSGLAKLVNIKSPMRMVVQGAAIGFSGLCIISQNMYVLKDLGIDWKHYLGVRMLSAMLLSLGCITIEGKWMGEAVTLFESLKINYAISLFIVVISIVPALILLSKNIFLNKTK